MRRRCRLLCGVVILAIGTTLAAFPGSAGAVGLAHNSVVAAAPDARTPQILDSSATINERVIAMAQVGNRIVVAGQFSRVKDVSTNGGQTLGRTNVFAFDATTGAVARGFAPVLNGAVNAVLAGADGVSVYLGGTFTSLNGASSRNLVQLSVVTGVRTAFRAPLLNGAINDVALTGGRLVVGGQFTAVGGVTHVGLATLRPTTGALDEYMGVDVALHHNYPATMLADSNGPMAAGHVAGVTATVPTASNRATVPTIVLSAG